MNGTAQKQGMSTGAKWGIGCSAGCLTLIGLLAVGSFASYRFLMSKVDTWVQELTALGFPEVVRGQVLEAREPIAKPTLYVGQSVKILSDCTTNLAIIAQVAEIHGRIDGKLYFRGQLLTIQPNAEIRNGLDVKAQVVQNRGKVAGDITGTYQGINE